MKGVVDLNRFRQTGDLGASTLSSADVKSVGDPSAPIVVENFESGDIYEEKWRQAYERHQEELRDFLSDLIGIETFPDMRKESVDVLIDDILVILRVPNEQDGLILLQVMGSPTMQRYMNDTCGVAGTKTGDKLRGLVNEDILKILIESIKKMKEFMNQ